MAERDSWFVELMRPTDEDDDEDDRWTPRSLSVAYSDRESESDTNPLIHDDPDIASQVSPGASLSALQASLALLNEGAPSTSSIDGLTMTTAKTQTTAQTSLFSQKAPGDHGRTTEGIQGATLEGIQETEEYPHTLLHLEDQDDQASITSVGSTIYTPQQRDDAVKRFSRAMLKRLNHNVHVASNDSSRQHILPHIRKAIKEFTETVEVDKPGKADGTIKAIKAGEAITADEAIKAIKADEAIKAQVKGVKMIRRLRSEIATKFHDSIYQEEDPNSGRIDLGDGAPMNFAEKIGNWASTDGPSTDEPSNRGPADNPIPAETWSDTQSSVSFGEETEVDFQLEGTASNIYGQSVDPVRVLEALTDQPAFEQLMSTVEHRIQQYYSEKMALIRSTTCLALRRYYPHRKGEGTLLRATFNVDWDLNSFLINSYEAGIHQRLDKIVAITGAIDTAHLCSVGQYFKWCWPRRSSQLLEALEQAIRDANSARTSPFRFPSGLPRSNTITVDPPLKTINVLGTESFIVSIAQQLAWLAAACQEKKNRLTYAYVGFSETSHSTDLQAPTFDIDVNLETISPAEDIESCWNSVIGPAVVITGFPVPDRKRDERGLEASVRVMAQLLGLPKAVTFRGGFVFKGRYIALVPVEKLGSSTQWHIVDSYPRKLEWDDIDTVCPTRIIGQAKMGFFLEGRSFVGWCPKVLESLGTAGYDYESVQYSKACAPSRWAQIDKLQLGFSQWGTITAEVTLGRKDGYRCQRPDDYETLLDDARNTHIILYDTTHRRATQTNGEDFILHTLLHQRSKKNQEAQTSASHQVDDLEFANPDRRETPTRTVMVNNAERVFCHRRQFSSSELQKSLFKHEVKSLYATIDGLWAQDYINHKSNSFIMNFDPRPSVHGWEYMDLVTSLRWMPPKSVKLKSTCGRWNEYARGIQALVFFGANFGDILTPAPPTVICPALNSVPRDHFCLGIRVDTLERLFTLQGSLRDQAKLTPSGLTLSGSTDLFKAYGDTAGGQEQCCPQRLVRFIVPGLRGKQCLLPLETDGAIVIGHIEDSILHKSCHQQGQRPMKNPLKGIGWRNITQRTTAAIPMTSVPIRCREEEQRTGFITVESLPQRPAESATS